MVAKGISGTTRPRFGGGILRSYLSRFGCDLLRMYYIMYGFSDCNVTSITSVSSLVAFHALVL